MNECHNVGVGPTDEFRLRVSVASLARVVFEDQEAGKTMLVLERKATFYPAEGHVSVKSQPFGGAMRINSLLPLKERIGDFHFDSQRSRFEQDFRIYIRPADWDKVREFCLEQFGNPGGSVLESGPDRELAEEFGDILGIDLNPDQYSCIPLGTVLENEPASTENVYAEGQPTVRLYRIYEVRVTDSALMKAMISNGQRFSNHELSELVREDGRKGGNGRANAMLVLPVETLNSFYRAMPEKERNSPATIEGFNLEPNVTTLLEGVMASKYQRV